jgi:hypothetical protein
MRLNDHNRVDAKETHMTQPTETAVIVAGIVLAFLVFMGALGWAVYYTRSVRTPGAVYDRKTVPDE